jgi:hypothetical protein
VRWALLVARCAGVAQWHLAAGIVTAVLAVFGCVCVPALRSDWNLVLFVLIAFPVAVLIACVVILHAVVQGLLGAASELADVEGVPVPITGLVQR